MERASEVVFEGLRRHKLSDRRRGRVSPLVETWKSSEAGSRLGADHAQLLGRARWHLRLEHHGSRTEKARYQVIVEPDSGRTGGPSRLAHKGKPANPPRETRRPLIASEI